MKFRLKTEIVQFNGQTSASSQIFVVDRVLIGRSSSCQVQLKEPSVAIHHATILLENEKLVIEVQKGAPAIRVNRSRKRRAILKPKDRVLIGDAEFIVFFDKSYWGFEQKRDERRIEEPKDIVARKLKNLDLNRFFPNHLILSLLVFYLVLLVGVVDPITGSGLTRWKSGPVSNPHRMFEDNCEQCHEKLFEPVEDRSCLACHQMSDHIKSAELRNAVHVKGTETKCSDCHHEHNGDRMTNSSDDNCVSCHARSEFTLPGFDGKGISSFEKHPEFRVATRNEPGKDLARTSLSLHPKFESTLRFNHEKHLAGALRSKNSEVELTCSSCHELDETKKNFQKLSFNKNCAGCHTLGFDPELPEREVPHGDANVVYQFLYGEYAKLLLSSATPPDRTGRVRPGAEVQEEKNRAFVQSAVEARARDGEALVFAKTGCQLCHAVHQKDATGMESRFEVLPGNPPLRWMPAAKFDHRAHTAVDCQECHAGTKKSADANDILMPSIQTCQKCHGDARVHHGNKVESPCISCHSFHEPLLISESNKRIIRDIRRRAH